MGERSDAFGMRIADCRRGNWELGIGNLERKFRNPKSEFCIAWLMMSRTRFSRSCSAGGSLTAALSSDYPILSSSIQGQISENPRRKLSRRLARLRKPVTPVPYGGLYIHPFYQPRRFLKEFPKSGALHFLTFK